MDTILTKKDFFWKDVSVGDIVAINPPRYKGLTMAKVEKLTPKGFTVTYAHQGYNRTTNVSEVVKK